MRKSKRSILVVIGLTLLLPLAGDAQSNRQKARKQNTKAKAAARKTPGKSSLSTSASSRKQNYMKKALSLANSKQYEEASKLLFQMSRSPMFADQSAQVKYVLGMTLLEMKLNQAAAFVFYDVVRQEGRNPGSKYLRLALSKLSLAADALESDVMLRYAVRKVDERDFPPSQKDMLYFRLGESKLADKEFDDAIRMFGKVRPTSAYGLRAKYSQGLAYAEQKKNEQALGAFEQLIAGSRQTVTDKNRVNGLMGRARVLYQMGRWGDSIEAYRSIPRDTEQWHDALFESSWAMLRGARFRSALSNFHSLHSAFYDEHYQPESLLLRAIVYLYICRYDEMEKVLDLFDRQYKPVQTQIRNALQNNRDSLAFFRELIRKDQEQQSGLKKSYTSQAGRLPNIVVSFIKKEGDVRKSLNYLRRLEVEKRRINGLSTSWRTSGIGKYAQKIVEKRIESTRVLAGKQFRRHLILVQNDLRDLFEQSNFLRFEMISGKKEVVKKEIAGKGLTRDENVDQDSSRDYYVQNGYEYWPFTGEYWLDEIGNYHYVGVQACE